MYYVEANKQLKIPSAADKRRARRIQLMRSPYLVWGLLSYILIVAMVMIYLNRTPVFSSNMALVLPGSGSSTSFQLDEVGAAKSQTSSPFAGASFNPRVNYKEILRSREVLEMASAKLGLNLESLGLPKVKLTEQTSIIQVDVKANQSELAREKAWAIYHAFQAHLDLLRADEIMRRDESIKNVLEQYRSRLAETRQSLIEFQERSLLVDASQLDKLMATLNDLRTERLFASAEHKQKNDFVQQLSFDLGVSPALAGKAFALQSDTQFKAHLRELDESAKEFSQFRSMWGNNHPKVKASQQRLEYARKAAFGRSSNLLGDIAAESLSVMNLEASPDRARLFGDLMDSYAQVRGSEAKISELQRTESMMEDRLRVLARESKELERLQREYDLAEAVFTSAAAELEAGKADVFASYPVVQLLTAPNAPFKQKSPDLKVAVAGGLAGFLFITTILLIVWQRTFLIKRLLARD